MYDAAVLGLGGMGSATAAHAARQGLSVVGFEQFTPAHDLGASHGRVRLIRKAYFEGAQYVPLLERAYELWREIEHDSATALFDRCGAVFVGTGQTNVVRGTIASAETYGLAIERLDAAGLAARFPALRIEPNECGVFEPAGGVVFPEQTVTAFIAQAQAAGAHLRFNTRVMSWEEGGSGVRIHLDDGSSVDARRLAVCCGPWFGELLGRLNIPLHVERNVQVWFEPQRPLTSKTLPPFALERDGRFFYGFPDYGDGIKCAFHHSGSFADSPESLERSVMPADIEPIRAQLASFVPDGEGPFRGASACMYALSADEHFIIGAHPESERIFIAGGFSGHGFKFVPVIGEIMGQYLASGRTQHDVTFFSPGRFA